MVGACRFGTGMADAFACFGRACDLLPPCGEAFVLRSMTLSQGLHHPPLLACTVTGVEGWVTVRQRTCAMPDHALELGT